MQRLAFEAELYPPDRPILLRPAMRTPQVHKPVLTRLFQFERLVVHAAGERTGSLAVPGKVKAGPSQTQRIVSRLHLTDPFRLIMHTALTGPTDEMLHTIQSLD